GETPDLAVQARWRDNGVGPDVHLGVDDLHGELLSGVKGETEWQEARVTRVSPARSPSSAAAGRPATVSAMAVPPQSCWRGPGPGSSSPIASSSSPNAPSR